MTYPEFVITHVNESEHYGHVRQLSSPDDVVHLELLGFDFDAVAQVVYTDAGTIRGYCIPHDAIKARVPQVGDRILGIIAHDQTRTLAFDERGAPFLRQWFYARQDDLFEGVNLSSNPYASFEDCGEDDPDADEYITDPDDLAEIAHGRANEMYNG